MSDKFIYCSKCGTRNFSDDEYCGVCKSKLLVHGSAEISNSKEVIPKSNYIPIIFILGLIIAGYILFLKPEKSDNSIEDKSDVEKRHIFYNHVITDLNSRRAFNVTVRINARIEPAELEELAKRVKDDINAKSDKGVVFFLLPGMIDGEGAWAAVDFNPQIRVRIIGQSIKDRQEIRRSLGSIEAHEGIWEDIEMSGDIMTRIRKDKKQGHIIEFISTTDHKDEDKGRAIIKREKNGLTYYEDTEWEGQYYLVEQNGDLSVYNQGKFVRKYKRVK